MKNTKYNVIQIKKGTFIFSSDSPLDKKIEVYLKQNPVDNKQEFLYETLDQTFEISIPNLNYRPYFLIKDSNSEYITAERTLPVDGMNNFRDMGGYETYNNRSVKWGSLYRSDHIYNATESGIEYLKKLNIHTIIDYRSDDEIEKYPNKIINENIATFVLDPAAHTAELSAQFTSSKNNEDKNLVDKIIEQKNKGLLVNRYDIVTEQYKNFVNKKESKEAFSKMIKIASNPDSPAIIQHCRGGKDRTGFGAILLLGLLGVKKESLILDYMLTHTNRIDRNNEKMEGYKKLTNDPEVLNYLYSLIETKSIFIETSINTVEQQYGSLRDYALNELNITNEMISSLEDLYLE